MTAALRPAAHTLSKMCASVKAPERAGESGLKRGGRTPLAGTGEGLARKRQAGKGNRPPGGAGQHGTVQVLRFFVDDNFHDMTRANGTRPASSAIAQSQLRPAGGWRTSFSNPISGRVTNVCLTYTMFGGGPFIVSGDLNCKFSARDYARERIRLLQVDP
jgi:hypothetical protein